MKRFVWLSMFLVNGLLWAQDSKSTFDDYLLELKQEAQTKGFDDTLLDKAFASIEFRQKAVQSDKSQPEFKLTLARYLKTRVPDWKVKQAVAAYKENQDILEEIGEKYAVQPRFIVALWANESNFGKIQGRYSVLSALSTLAFEGRRETFFKKQFFAALQVVDEGHIKIEDFVGSWAGALGQCQFIPTSFLTYGVDYNDDGKKDIWQTKADVFASIANYLQSEGWDDDLTWGRQVILPDTIQLEQSGLGTSKKKSLQQWADLGITRLNGHSLPVRDIKANLIMADQGQGNSYLVYGNFDTLMRWNRSIYFGVGIGYLADAIKRELNNES